MSARRFATLQAESLAAAAIDRATDSIRGRCSSEPCLRPAALGTWPRDSRGLQGTRSLSGVLRSPSPAASWLPSQRGSSSRLTRPSAAVVVSRSIALLSQPQALTIAAAAAGSGSSRDDERQQWRKRRNRMPALASNSTRMLSLGSPLVELLRIIRMGGLSGRAKILSEDVADQDVESESASHSETGDSSSPPSSPASRRAALLARCRVELAGLPEALKRQFVEAALPPQADGEEDRIRVMQWNILAQSLAEKSDKFVCCPETLNWTHRRWRILEEILTYAPDVVCLQEVDHYNFLKATLGRTGFEGVFFPKPDSPCCYNKGNNGPDGCAIFFDSAKYTLVGSERRVLEVFRCQSNQVVIFCTFRRQQSGRLFCVATTHLKARVGSLLPTLRNEQGKDLLAFVRACNPMRHPVIYAGDFNAEPSEPVYRTMIQSGELSSSYAMVPTDGALQRTFAGSTIVSDTGHNDVITPEHARNHAALTASDATGGAEPSYTTWKIREDGEVCHTIDYIFFSRGRFAVERVLEMPTGEQLGPARAPSPTYPSDHFALCCDLRLL